MKIPSNWKGFLRIEAADKEVYRTYGIKVVSNTRRECLEDLQPCNHEKADTRIFFHVLDAVKQHNSIVVRTIDTDVFVLSVAQMQRFPQKEVWLAFGMGKMFRYYPIHEIARSLGQQESLALPVFHALTGCDIVSFFCREKHKKCR